MTDTKFRELFKIFITFFKIGLFTFGGGFAMIPIIEKEVVEKHGWVDKDKFLDTISITQTVPGAVAINMAIFLGYNLLGFFGALAAAIGVALPSFIIILLIAVSFNQFSNNQIVQSAFMGIRPAVVALIAYAGYKLSGNIDWSSLLVIFLVVTLVGRIILGISPIYIILAAGITGLAVNYFSERKMDKQNNGEV